MMAGATGRVGHVLRFVWVNIHVSLLTIKGALFRGLNNVPTECVCCCFQELSDPRVFHLSGFTCRLALYNQLFVYYKS